MSNHSFKVGDKVKIIKEEYPGRGNLSKFKVSETFIIGQVTDNYLRDKIDGWGVHYDLVELVEEEFKVGDKVLIDNNYSNSRFGYYIKRDDSGNDIFELGEDCTYKTSSGNIHLKPDWYISLGNNTYTSTRSKLARGWGEFEPKKEPEYKIGDYVEFEYVDRIFIGWIYKVSYGGFGIEFLKLNNDDKNLGYTTESPYIDKGAGRYSIGCGTKILRKLEEPKKEPEYKIGDYVQFTYCDDVLTGWIIDDNGMCEFENKSGLLGISMNTEAMKYIKTIPKGSGICTCYTPNDIIKIKEPKIELAGVASGTNTGSVTTTKTIYDGCTASTTVYNPPITGSGGFSQESIDACTKILRDTGSEVNNNFNNNINNTMETKTFDNYKVDDFMSKKTNRNAVEKTEKELDETYKGLKEAIQELKNKQDKIRIQQNELNSAKVNMDVEAIQKIIKRNSKIKTFMSKFVMQKISDLFKEDKGDEFDVEEYFKD